MARAIEFLLTLLQLGRIFVLSISSHPLPNSRQHLARYIQRNRKAPLYRRELEHA
jgi:hypothetical protein